MKRKIRTVLTILTTDVFFPEGGGTPLYGLYRYVRLQGVWFSSGFGLKKGIDFDHFHSGFSLIGHFVYKELFFPRQHWQMCSSYKMFIQMKPILARAVIY